MERPFGVLPQRNCAGTIRAPQNVPRSNRFVSSAAVPRRMPTEHFKVRVAAFTVNLKKKIFKTMEDSTGISAPSRRRRQVIDELPRSQTHTERAEIRRVPSGRRRSGQRTLHPFNLTSAGAPGRGGASRSPFACSSFDSLVTSVLKLGVCEPCVCSML